MYKSDINMNVPVLLKIHPPTENNPFPIAFKLEPFEPQQNSTAEACSIVINHRNASVNKSVLLLEGSQLNSIATSLNSIKQEAVYADSDDMSYAKQIIKLNSIIHQLKSKNKKSKILNNKLEKTIKLVK